MLEFVKNWFKKVFEVFLWLILIASAIGGGFLFNEIFRYDDYMIPVGVIAGLAIGILIDILWGGIIATFMNIDKNLEILAGKNSSEDTSKSTDGDSGRNPY